MKSKKTISILIVIVAIIIAGIVTVAFADFNYNFDYSRKTTVFINLGKEYSEEDINNILDEIFGKTKRTLEIKKEYFTLNIKGDVSEEQKTTLLGKLNEKYETELTADDLTINIIPKMQMKDMIAPYIVPFIISSALVLIYLVIIYRKARIEEVIILTVTGIIAVQLVYFSIIAITRMPVGNYIMPISMYIYVTTVLITTKVLGNLKKK